MNDMRHWINLVESVNPSQDTIPGERSKYNTIAKQLEAVQRDGDEIQLIKNPSLAVQLTAVRQNGHAVQWIRNPSLDVQLAAVQKNGYSIRHIKNPSEQVQLAAVQQNGWVIYWILEKRIIPSIAVQRYAVLNDPVWALDAMIKYNFPISKMIQWTAAKEIKERNLVSCLDEKTLNKLDLDVQEYLRVNDE